MTLSDCYDSEGNDFTDALIEHIEQQQIEERNIMLDNDLYEHSAE